MTNYWKPGDRDTSAPVPTSPCCNAPVVVRFVSTTSNLSQTVYGCKKCDRMFVVDNKK